MDGKISVAKWSSLVLGILSIIAGVLFIINPLDATVIMVNVFGVYFIISGILRIIRYFSSPWFRTGGFLVSGILDVVLGFIMIRNSLASTVALSFLIAFWVLIQGITEIATSFDLKNLGLPTWWLNLIIGILGVIFGFLLLGNFNLASAYITVLTASYLFIMGIGLITMFFTISNIQDRLR